MRKIKLTKGKVAIVDDDMFDFLNQWSWSFDGWYATRWISSIKRNRSDRVDAIGMHRVVADTPEGKDTDHKNGNRLDNRRENLRICTKSQNQHNKGISKNNTSGYKGVHQNRWGDWVSQIKLNHKQIYLGTFQTPIEAAIAYNEAALEYHGEFAYQNEV